MADNTDSLAEKGRDVVAGSDTAKGEDHILPATETGFIDEVLLPHNKFQRWALHLEEKLGLEARGIERVPEEVRARKTATGDYIQMGLIWFSANLTANNTMLGLLGPLVFYVGLKDGMILAAFGAMFGAACAAYISTFGPVSGNRTLVIARYTMGWWPSRVCVLLNIVIMLGYGLIDLLIAGQILSRINGSGMSVIVGVVISAIITLAICIFGIRVFHIYERYAYIPQLIVLFILIGCAGPYWDTKTPSEGTTEEQHADRMSFFFLCMSGCLAWAPASADFYVYFPPDAKRWKVFTSTTLGLGLSCAFTYMVGVGIASGVAGVASWGEAYDVSVGALFDQVYSPLGAFGHVCSCIIALGLISNVVPSLYSGGLSFQLLGRWPAQLPRLFWTTVSVVICTVLACAGREKLFEIFESFLALIGYWTAFWVTMTLEEELIFRRTRGYDWTTWNNQSKLPIGIAAFIAFLVGWAGAVLGMWQTYYTGPLGKLVGVGIDLGMPVSSAWAAIVYPPLRWLELKYIGR
ncbi:Purine-cytosine permease [Pleurostoma richardsiae]|uniref:Purine-cytosine permease n=1 Tax=Pleurostoma richardsiae TaxID=41990 RepID=A0AA38VT85_9PEZI|nr:Purine-cytosine permease [Pleurostoma richardsiae]